MKRIAPLVALLLLAFASTDTARAQALNRPVVPAEATLFTFYRGAALAAAAGLGGHVLPSRGFRVTAFVAQSSAAGVGAGTVTLRISDGTNNCDAAADCVTTGLSAWGNTGPKRLRVTNGVCSFAPGAYLTATVLSTTCATTQPSITISSVVGFWQ